MMLWEAEQPNHRIKHEEAVLYDSWPNAQVFRMAVQKSKEKGVHKWSSECVIAIQNSSLFPACISREIYARIRVVGAAVLTLLWLCVLRREQLILVVTAEGHASIEHFYREMRNSGGGGGGGGGGGR